MSNEDLEHWFGVDIRRDWNRLATGIHDGSPQNEAERIIECIGHDMMLVVKGTTASLESNPRDRKLSHGKYPKNVYPNAPDSIPLEDTAAVLSVLNDYPTAPLTEYQTLCKAGWRDCGFTDPGAKYYKMVQ